MTIEKINKLTAITREKNLLLNTICDITRYQKSEIEKESMDELNKLMDKKDTLMKKIDKLDLTFITIFSQIKKEHSIDNIDELDIEKYPNLEGLKDAVKEVYSTLMTISLMDDENTKIIKDKLEETRMELRKLKEGKKAYKGYNPSITGSMLIDEKK